MSALPLPAPSKVARAKLQGKNRQLQQSTHPYALVKSCELLRTVQSREDGNCSYHSLLNELIVEFQQAAGVAKHLRWRTCPLSTYTWW